MTDISDMTAMRLWQLISPALPVGAYSYSQGLESAVEYKWVDDEASALDWISGQLSHALAALDVPVLKRLHLAWQQQDTQQVDYWNTWLLASRETKEWRDEDQQMGSALLRLLPELGIQNTYFDNTQPISFGTAFTCAAVHWQIGMQESIQGYLWAWCENQVMAAVKLIPLGQTAGQRLLLALAERIPSAVAYGIELDDDAIGQVNPVAVMGSMLHETQYSRLFRS